MKKLITLAKELDFSTEEQYFDYCIDSHINGNFIQCEDLFEPMKVEDKERLIKYIMDTVTPVNTIEPIRSFYFKRMYNQN